MNKTYIVINIIFFLLAEILYSQPCSLSVQPIKMYPAGAGAGYGDFELAIYNQTLWYGRESSDTIMIKILPVGAFFNADFKYNPKAKNLIGDPQDTTTISGSIIKIPPQSSANSYSRVVGNWDKSGSSGTSKFAYGYGNYKIEFYRRVFFPYPINDYQWEFSDFVCMDIRDIGDTTSSPLSLPL